MKTLKSFFLTTIILGSFCASCYAAPLSSSSFIEVYTVEEFIMEYGEDAYNKTNPTVKKPVQPVSSEKAEPTKLKKGNSLQSAMFFQK